MASDETRVDVVQNKRPWVRELSDEQSCLGASLGGVLERACFKQRIHQAELASKNINQPERLGSGGAGAFGQSAFAALGRFLQAFLAVVGR